MTLSFQDRSTVQTHPISFCVLHEWPIDAETLLSLEHFRCSNNEICMEFSSQDSGQKKRLRCIEVLLNKSLLRPTIIVM
ncbi:hypothetical protein NC651_031610 [Populus alba x Populus x berolinensis]|nr:hypothetical protein NC651_031610 [Populus alba x Populus x berolinensis]